MLLLQTTCFSQNLVTNGSFELPGFATPPFYQYMAAGDATTIAGWVLENNGAGEQSYLVNVGYANDGAVEDGNYSLVLSQGSAIQTTFATSSNSTYELSFWMTAANPQTDPNYATPDPLVIHVAGYTATFPSSSIQPVWGHETFRFVAQSNDTAAVLEMVNASQPTKPFRGYGLDNVVISNLVTGSDTFSLAERTYPGLIIIGTAGRHYQIQYVTSLSATNTWNTLTNIFLPTSPYLFIDADPLSPLTYPPQRFYRAILLQ
jgi:hypothetical protein